MLGMPMFGIKSVRIFCWINMLLQRNAMRHLVYISQLWAAFLSLILINMSSYPGRINEL